MMCTHMQPAAIDILSAAAAAVFIYIIYLFFTRVKKLKFSFINHSLAHTLDFLSVLINFFSRFTLFGCIT